MKRTFEEFEKDYKENNVKRKINGSRIDDYIQKTSGNSPEMLCDLFVMQWNECVESFQIGEQMRAAMSMVGGTTSNDPLCYNCALLVGGKPVLFFTTMDDNRQFNVVKIPWNCAMTPEACYRVFASHCIPSSEVFIENLIFQFSNPLYFLPVTNNYSDLNWKHSNELKQYCRFYYNRTNKKYTKRIFFETLNGEIVLLAVDFLDKFQSYTLVRRGGAWVRCGNDLANSFIDQIESFAKCLPKHVYPSDSPDLKEVDKNFDNACKEFRILSCFEEQI